MIILDAEWTTKADRIHAVGVLNTDDSTYHCFTRPHELLSYLGHYPDAAIVGHYAIYSDLPMLRKHWAIDLSGRQVVDTFTMSTLLQKTQRHGLADWGKVLGMHKGDFTDFDGPAEGEHRADWWVRLTTYLEQDVRLTELLFRHLRAELINSGFAEGALMQELSVARIVQQQMETGFFFDVDKAGSLYTLLSAKHGAVKEKLQEMFPPIIYKRVSEKTGKPLKDRVEVFNPASRQQIAKRLISVGVKLSQRTDKGAHKISEEVLDGLSHPAAVLVKEYLMLEKRIGQLNQWFYYYNSDTHRIHGRVNPLGTNTHRQSQSSPNLAQVPSLRVPYGKECRELFTVPDGKVLVGVDASGLELRLLANRLGDPKYKELVEGGDVHTYNMEMAGLTSRAQAKTFIYAFIYGASNRKLAHILGVSEKEAGDVRARFLRNIPAFEDFKRRTEAEAQRSGGVTLMDGSKVWVDSMHSILNYQLQGDGAVAMKRALCNFHPSMIDLGARLVVQAHDEWQIECPYWCSDVVGQAAVRSIEKVTSDYSMFVKLTGEYKVGPNWAATH